MAIENMEVDFQCPDCEKEFKVKLSQIQDKATIKCPRCKKNIDLKAEEDILKQIEKRLIRMAEDFRSTDLIVDL